MSFSFFVHLHCDVKIYFQRYINVSSRPQCTTTLCKWTKRTVYQNPFLQNFRLDNIYIEGSEVVWIVSKPFKDTSLAIWTNLKSTVSVLDITLRYHSSVCRAPQCRQACLNLKRVYGTWAAGSNELDPLVVNKWSAKAPLNRD